MPRSATRAAQPRLLDCASTIPYAHKGAIHMERDRPCLIIASCIRDKVGVHGLLLIPLIPGGSFCRKVCH